MPQHPKCDTLVSVLGLTGTLCVVQQPEVYCNVVNCSAVKCSVVKCTELECRDYNEEHFIAVQCNAMQ